MASDDVQNRPGNRTLIARLLLAVGGMFAFGFALVPLYDVLCNIAGLNGKSETIVSRADDVNFGKDTDRKVTVQFVTTVNNGMPWEFSAVRNTVKVHPGALETVQFKARNTSDRAMVGQAVPSVRPSDAAGYLHKTECFCFSQQPFD